MEEKRYKRGEGKGEEERVKDKKRGGKSGIECEGEEKVKEEKIK